MAVLRRLKLIQRRETLGYSQEQLAFKLGCERSTLIRWEHAETTPRPNQRRPYAQHLEITLSELAEMLDAVSLVEEQPTPVNSLGAPRLAQRADDTGDGDDGLSRIVESDRTTEISIARDGMATLIFSHEVWNRGAQPFRRLVRELWFQHTSGQLSIEPHPDVDRSIGIQRIHDTPNFIQFACLISPAITSGERATVKYMCEGGRFVTDHYWRQATQRYTESMTVAMRHEGAVGIVDCTAVEERPDGSEVMVTDDIDWHYEGDDVVMSITRRNLQPCQAVTLRWSVRNPIAETR